MSDKSPLVERISSGKDGPPRLRFPRKGLIRTFLALLLVAVFVKLVVFSDRNDGDGAAQFRELPVVPKGFLGFFGKKIGDRELGVVLPRLVLTGDRDTILYGRDSLLVCFALDTALQARARRLFERYHPRYGVLAALEPESGRVVALVEYSHPEQRYVGDHLYCRNLFPAASIFKTVTASAALESADLSRRTKLPVTGRSHTLYRTQIKKTITPWNKVTLEEAFAYSNNPVFARLGMHVIGSRAMEKSCLRWGFNTAIPFELAVDSSRVAVPPDTSYAMAELASGFNRKTVISPLHGALIAAAAARGGTMPRPRLVDSVVEVHGGRSHFVSEPSVWKTAIDEETAVELRRMMRRVITSGTARKSFRTFKRSRWTADLDYGGKTGSINVDSLGKIDWFVGFAVGREGDGRGLAVGLVTVHGGYWTVRSSYLASEILRTHLRPRPLGSVARP